MSISLMTTVWAQAPVEGTPLLVLLALADAANDEGICWPSVQTLATKARVKPRRISEVLGELESIGWLERDFRSGRSTMYKVRTPVPQDTPVPRDTPVLEDTPTPVPQDTPPLSPRTGRTIKEPPVEPSTPVGTPFAEFWNAWPAHPRKTARSKAEAIWRRLNESQRQRTLTALTSAKASRDWTKANGQYIPMPTTWLNREPWENETPTLTLTQPDWVMDWEAVGR